MPHAPSQDEKILVTGGTGFIGRHLLRALCAQGCQPTALTRHKEAGESLTAALREQVRWIEIDVTDSKAVLNLIQRERPAVIYHLAGTRGKFETGRAKSVCEELNVRATVNLMEAAKGTGLKRLIITGSADEYGNQAGQLKESFPVQPTSEYGRSKAEATRLAQEMFAKDGLPVVTLRPFTVYGPDQPREMFIAEAIECAVNNLPFEMSEGTQKRDLIFVEDVVRALLASASAPELEGKVINLGSGKAQSLRSVAQLIWRISSSRAPLLIGARPASAHEIHDTCADITLALQLLDWEPRIATEEGLRRTIEWQRARQEKKILTTEEESVNSNITSRV